MAAYARSEDATGARCAVVLLPRRVDLEHARADGRMPNLDFVEAVNRTAPVVRLDVALIGKGDLGPLFRPGGHYSPEA